MERSIRQTLVDIAGMATGAVGLIDKEKPVDRPEPPVQDTGDAWRKPFFGGKRAPWAVPISAGLRVHPDNAKLRRQLMSMTSGAINCNAFAWAIAIYYFNAGTPSARLVVERDNWCNMGDGQTIPWHPDWEHATDGDSYVSIVDEGSGACYLVWQPRYDKARNIMRCGTANVVKTTAREHRGEIENIWTGEVGFRPSRAAGIAQPYGLTVPQELEAGEINHCLAVGLPKPSRVMVPPATKKIGAAGTSDPDRLGTGYRFAFALTNDELHRWADTFSGSMRRHALTLGRCVRDYGMILVDHAGDRERRRGGIYFENDITADWESIGAPQSKLQTCLHGLLMPNMSKAWFVEEPKFPGNNIDRVAVYDKVMYPERYR